VRSFAVWAQGLRRAIVDRNDLVFITLDKTSVERLVPRWFGNVLCVPRAGLGAAAVYERISRRDTHGHLTLVGLVTPTPGLQQFLPQMLLPKDANLSAAERIALASVQFPLE
jgi:hypothetical protein